MLVEINAIVANWRVQYGRELRRRARPFVRSSVVAMTMVATLSALAACAASPPKASAPELSYANLGPIRLDVAKIEIIDDYLPPLKRPNVEHEFPISPAEAVQRWARDRLVAGGREQTARFIIRAAGVREIALKKKTGLRGLLTTDQSERYEGRVAVVLEVRSQRGFRDAFAEATSSHARTVAENASINQREQLFLEITERLVRDLNSEIEKQIAAHLAPYRLP